ncbi:Bax inhibitor-1/YccA family protein [Pseudemcibacter aquimaris]|uniref:Bax inhibitor-1/YccA family protein n=1 Tax=Pseudemcibacter aquimaris TaxID=2857064 RepID=UPI002010F91A|nr:Bax inhibitor-1/YccA family protein [Pseudemcibacter aquimaris]MCC3862238.1 Bax inhibitor-1/YccA family protein [Pseudemcibacter aquimaris]WDU58990.1 Bax inhibitor-1/YccA family protein [Pseudemcibacter aquimaris]
MVDQNQYYSNSRTQTAAEIDEGLRAYMLTVYNYMASALALTGLAAYVTANTPALASLFFTAEGGRTGLGMILFIVTIGLSFGISAGLNRMKASTVQILYWVFAVLFGVSLSYVLMIYTGVSIARTFFITAAAFGSLSIYGYTTKRNLAPLGTFLMMGLIGLLISGLVNAFFLQSTMLHFVTSAVGVLIFAGFTAYDTQKIKLWYDINDSHEVAKKKAIYGALDLYLDFILLFLHLLQFLGNRE